MYAITGITGKVGGAVARALLSAGRQVRAVVRSADKGTFWAEQGCEVAVAAIDDADAMAAAFRGAEGVFLMTPSNFDPAPGFPDTHGNLAAILRAIEIARPDKLVFLSTVGAHVAEPNLLNNSKITEEGLRALSLPVGFVRAAWFMENASWDVVAARAGEIPSFLQPLDHPIPMIATSDIGHTAAAVLQETWVGTKIVELEAPRRYSANDIAAGFARAVGHAVRPDVVPRDGWEALFRSQGAKYPLPRMRMIDGFNEGWIDFEGGAAEKRTGQIDLDTVLRQLVEKAG
jgi:NAD(P)H dehydrogenase (quinone)